MNFLRAICRILVGIAFIVSGYFKAVDPVGFELKIKEYLNAFHLSFFNFSAIFVAVAICALEFVIGVAILKGIKIKFFSKIALLFISFFTLLTLITVIFDPVHDCGCFGDIIHFTNLQSFLKNILLLSAILLIYMQRDKFKPIATCKWEMVYLAFYSLFIISISAYSLIMHPVLDFGIYKAGTNLNLLVGEMPEHSYNATFIYEKEGKRAEFTLENLPDSTWEYIDTKTKLIDKDSVGAQTADFVLKNSAGEYITSQISESETPVFLVSFYDFDNISKRTISKLTDLNAAILDNGGILYGLSGNSPEEAASISSELPFDFIYSDYKTVLSLNRINGGLTYVNEGVIINKWGRREYPVKKIDKILSINPQVLTAEVMIKEKLFMEISVFVIIFMVAILRYISKFRYARYISAENDKK